MAKRFIVFISLVAIMTAYAAQARDMKQLLTSHSAAVDSIFLGQPRNLRLDMIDYFEAGSQAFVNDELTGSKIRISDLSDNHVRIETNTPVAYDFYAVAAGSDSLSVAIISAPIGAGDAEVVIEDIYTGKLLQRIDFEYSDWLNPAVVDTNPSKTDSRRAHSVNTLRAAVPFITVTATFDADTGLITLTNRAIETPGLDPSVAESFIPSKTLRWNGHKFVVKK